MGLVRCFQTHTSVCQCVCVFEGTIDTQGRALHPQCHFWFLPGSCIWSFNVRQSFFLLPLPHVVCDPTFVTHLACFPAEQKITFMAMMLKMVNAQGLVLWGLCCVLHEYLWNKGQGEGILLGTGDRREYGIPQIQSFSTTFPHSLFSHKPLKKPQDLGSQTRLCTKEGNLTSPSTASKAAVILRAQPLYWHTDLMIYTVQGIKCFKKLTLFRRARSSCISVPSFVWGWDWLWGGQEEPDGSINETLGRVSQTDSSTRSMFSCQNIPPRTELQLRRLSTSILGWRQAYLTNWLSSTLWRMEWTGRGGGMCN